MEGGSDKKPQGSSSSPEDSLPSSSPTPEPYRHKANAPQSPYPPPSTNEYPPRTPAHLRKQKGGTSPTTHSPPAFTIQAVLPQIVSVSGRPTYPPRAPNKNDERCIIYCSQTASRRSVGQQPLCKTFCWRRLFAQDFVPLEEQTGMTTKTIPSGNAKGSNNITIMPGGQTVVKRGNLEAQPGIFGFDGRFVYFGKSRFRARDRMDSMSHPGLSQDWSVDEMVRKDDPQRENEEYINFLRKYHQSIQLEVGPLPSQLYARLEAQISSAFSPFRTYARSFEAGGLQERLAKRMWEKTQDGEPARLVADVGKKLWRALWSGGDGNDDGSGPGPTASPP